MKLVVHLYDLTDEEIRSCYELKIESLKIRVHHYDNTTTIISFGSYDDLVNLIKKILIYKNYTLHLM